MPDEADVEQALASFVSGALYPDGVMAASSVGTVCRVYRGWPLPASLEADLIRGIAHLTVQPVKGSVKDTTRYSMEWQGSAPACPLLVDVEDEAVRFSGIAAPGMIAGVRVDGKAYAWRVDGVSSPGVVAAVLADMVRADRPAVLSGSVVQFPGGRGVSGRAVSDGQGGQELRRQEGLFKITAWCPSPSVRDEVAAAVDLALAEVSFLDVGGWGCRVRAAGGSSEDEGAAVRSWKRELLLRIEWPTVLKSSLPSMLFGSGSVNGAGFLA